MQKLAGKNIKATALEDFWGNKFNESIYLWSGAKHTIPIVEWELDTNPVLPDYFSIQKNVLKAISDCNFFFEKFSLKLSNCLNQIHEVNFSPTFWRIVFCVWMHEYICILYDKYNTLSQIDLDSNDIKLLDEQSFYIPEEYFDCSACFSTDFGVQQLVSNYYYLFANKNFSKLVKEYPLKKAMYSNFINYKKAKNTPE